jgi:hypothetical protein
MVPTAGRVAEPTRVRVMPAVPTGPVRPKAQRGEYEQQDRDAERKQEDQVMPL